MKTKIYLFSLLVFWLLTAGACNEDDSHHEDQLPPITQTGANTAGYKLNGKVILPKDLPANWSLPSGYKGLIADYEKEQLYDYGKNLFIIRITHYTNSYKEEQVLKIYKSVLDDTEYVFYRVSGNGKAIGDDYLGYTSTLKLIEKKITWLRKDTINQIYSGTFSIKYVDKETQEKTEITDGRFDINLNTLNKD